MMHQAPPEVYSLDTVLYAVGQLYSPALAGDAKSSKDADRWLRAFQKSQDAWEIADAMLKKEAVGQEAQLFAAQTLRQKVRYDAIQLDSPAQRLAVRDALLGQVVRFRRGPRAVVRQLCVALAALAVHVKEWADPVASMFDLFAQSRDDWPLLVAVLAALPYEFEDGATDSSFFLNKDESTDRTKQVIHSNTNKVLHALVSMLDQCDPTADPELLRSVLDCVKAWIDSGDLSLEKIAATNIVPRCFAYLSVPSQDLDEAVFDISVDVLCEIIRRSGSQLASGRDTASVMPLVECIYNGLMGLANGLKGAIAQQEEEEDRLRGFCQLYVYGGESYMSLILSNPEAWTPIAEAILACTCIKDLEIVAITFQFWQILADEVSVKDGPNQSRYRPFFLDLYNRLNNVMIGHLHYPPENNAWTAKERDEFREFRHNMGDVLKACVLVLGQQEALARPYSILQGFVVEGAPGGTLNSSTPWQQIEAPLFALRTIGRNISDDESTVLPVIMGMLPQLPSHPKIRYAAILVIGRYASWTKMHPEFLSYQMTFIAKGFEETEAIGAASQSLRFLCDECGDQLVGYLSQLHPFYLQIVKVLNRQDKSDVITALANVIKHVPVESTGDSPNMLRVLEMFCLPIAQRLNEIGCMPVPAGGFGQELQEEVSDLVGQFTTFISKAKPAVPAAKASFQNPCTTLFKGMWPVLESLLRLNDPKIINAVSKLIVRCVEAQHAHFAPLAAQVLPVLATTFDASEVSSTMWAAGKCVKELGSDDAQVGGLMHSLVQSMSRTAFKKIQEAAGNVDHVSDVVEDYFMLLTEFLRACPTHFSQSPLLPSFFQCAIACMSILQFNAWLALYADFFKSFFLLATQPPQPQIGAPLLTEIRTQSAGFMKSFLTGITSTFPYREDIAQEEGSGSAIVGSIVVGMCDAFGGAAEGLRVIGAAVGAMVDPKFGEVEKQGFAAKLGEALDKRDTYRVDVLMHEYGVKYRRRNGGRK
ncbi:Nuclear import receptor [Podochytrium sp. JEL0797]|nr:Nuclear import receptor [Podochytrium sp. JEL0797]